MKNKGNMKLSNTLTRWTLTTWALTVSYTIGMSSLSHAATLSAVVIPNTGGDVGHTATVSSSFTGFLHDKTWKGRFGMSTISTQAAQCLQKTNAKLGSLKVYGIPLLKDGVYSGAVLLPDGTAQWKRKTLSGQEITGTVHYNKGQWTNTWSTANGVATSKSNTEGESPYEEGYIFCPNIPSTEWDPSYTRSSSVNVRFVVDAPAGGLPAGRYQVPDKIYHSDFSMKAIGDKFALLVDSVEIIVANYSCSLSTDKHTVALSNLFPEATINLRVQCQDGGGSNEPISAWLSATSAGVSASIATGNPQTLGVQNSAGAMTIRGSWSDTAPANCNDTSLTTTLYFNDSDGIKVGDVNVGGSLTKNQPVSFRLCITGKPATGTSYTAQATFWVVQR